MYDAHAAELYGFAVRTLGDRGAAEDLVQEVLFRAWLKADTYRPERGSARGWLFAIARNLAVDVTRARAARPELVGVSGDQAGLGDELAGVERRILLLDVLARLTTEHRTVLIEVAIRGRPLADVAGSLLVPVGTVKSRLGAPPGGGGDRVDVMTSCGEIRTELGAYALGVLDPAAVDAVERHLSGCARCRAELAELSLAAGLLQDDAARAVATDASGAPSAADQALAAIAEARQRERRSLRRARGAALGGGAAFVAAAMLAGGLALRPVDRFAPEGSIVALTSVEATAAAASVTLTSRPWGTQVDLVARAMPPLQQGAYYEVWLVRPDGSRVAAGSFRPTAAGGGARVRLAAAVALADVTHIGVTREGDGPGVTVLRAPLA